MISISRAAVFALILSLAVSGLVTARTVRRRIRRLGARRLRDCHERFRALAERGDTRAQYKIGVMFQRGWGVASNYQEAVIWFRLAADQGNSDAQKALGFNFLYGRGVSRDYVRAHMWFNLAAYGGNKSAAFTRDLTAAKMTPAEVAEAEKLAQEWEPK
jgi:TPR repeat protein